MGRLHVPPAALERMTLAEIAIAMQSEETVTGTGGAASMTDAEIEMDMRRWRAMTPRQQLEEASANRRF